MLKGEKMKKLLSFVLATSMAMSLMACSSKAEDYSELITGSVDLDIKSSLTNVYLEDSGMTEAQAWGERDDVCFALVDYMLYIYGFAETADTAIVSEYIPLYIDILKQFEYTASEPVENDDGSVTVTLTYQTISLGDALDEVAYPFYDQLPEQGELTYEEYAAQQDELLFAELLVVTEDFAQDVQFGDEMSMDITVSTDDNYWTLSDNYYSEFVYSIIDLNMDY